MQHMMERTTHLEKMSSSTLEVGLASVSIFQLILNIGEIIQDKQQKRDDKKPKEEVIKRQRKA